MGFVYINKCLTNNNSSKILLKNNSSKSITALYQTKNITLCERGQNTACLQSSAERKGVQFLDVWFGDHIAMLEVRMTTYISFSYNISIAKFEQFILTNTQIAL